MTDLVVRRLDVVHRQVRERRAEVCETIHGCLCLEYERAGRGFGVRAALGSGVMVWNDTTCAQCALMMMMPGFTRATARTAALATDEVVTVPPPSFTELGNF